MAAAIRRGLTVAPFKVGPDFIDPGHHSRITGKISRNLDGWMLNRDTNLSSFHKACDSSNLAVIEGVMGLFDGIDGQSEAGSTAQMAKWLKAPVVLVVDARHMARSAAALIQGFERFDPQLSFAGVIFNYLGSPRHLSYLKEALIGHVKMPCLGGVSKNEAVAMAERHLGLVTDNDHPLSGHTIEHLADLIESSLDLNALLAGLPHIEVQTPPAEQISNEPTCCVRIGVALDNAFCFYYPENLELLQRAGAEVVRFSPIHDPDLPSDLDGIYFGGGYPELSADKLSDNKRLRHQVLAKSQAGMPIYGECGGLMYLCREIEDLEGRRHPMTGCLPFVIRMLPHLKSLGYREVTLARDTLLGPAGQTLRGHEFHYSEIIDDTTVGERVYQVQNRDRAAKRTEGYLARRTLGSYFHLHWGSFPPTARHFVESCLAYRKERIPSP
jgi:cobyrinic acid a,c-diamide synthase